MAVSKSVIIIGEILKRVKVLVDSLTKNNNNTIAYEIYKITNGLLWVTRSSGVIERDWYISRIEFSKTYTPMFGVTNGTLWKWMTYEDFRKTIIFSFGNIEDATIVCPFVRPIYQQKIYRATTSTSTSTSAPAPVSVSFEEINKFYEEAALKLK